MINRLIRPKPRSITLNSVILPLYLGIEMKDLRSPRRLLHGTSISQQPKPGLKKPVA